MRVTVLASGSAGNATLISAGGSRVIVDAGVGPSRVKKAMRRTLGGVVDVDAIVLTHPHGDHVSKCRELAASFDCPLWVTEASERKLNLDGLERRRFGYNMPFDVGAIQIAPMPVPHDAPNVALVFEHAGLRAGLVTDLGHVPRRLSTHLEGCQLVLLESNHDPEMLAKGPYPEFLKRRVASRTGHLSNHQAAELCARLGARTREVVLMHLSETNNAPVMALAQARAALRGRRVKVRCAHQDEPLDLIVGRAARATEIAGRRHEPAAKGDASPPKGPRPPGRAVQLGLNFER